MENKLKAMSTGLDIDKVAEYLSGGLSPEQLRERFVGQYGERRFPRQEPTEIEREYWQKVFKERPAGNALMVTRSTKQEMEYSEARIKVWNLMQLRAAHISDLEGVNFEWRFDDEEKERNANLVKYFINDPSCSFPLSKGLFIYGAPGTGKTEIMQVFARFCKENGLSKAFEMVTLSRVYETAKVDKGFDPITPNVQGDKCFDEFGRHVGCVNIYGNDLDINEAILEGRYDRAKRYGQLTHVIANITPNETESKFTPMVFDRLRSICTGVYFKGESKRK